MNHSEVSGWQANFLTSTDQLAAQRANLLKLIGRRLVDSWIVWNLDDDTWFADLPVVLLFDDGQQLELCWEKFDDLSISWNPIDVAIPPQAWVTWPLEWRSAKHASLKGLVGNAVTDVSATEFVYTAPRYRARKNWRDSPEARRAATGLWLEFGSTGLHVFNALDENGMSSYFPVVDGHRATSLRV